MKRVWLIIVIIAASFIIPILSLQHLPDRIVTHWGIHDEPNGTMGKTIGVFFSPVLSLVFLGIFLLLPKIDPFKNNIEKFREQFDLFLVVFLLFMLYINSLVIAWNLGFVQSLTTWFIPGLGILLYYTGVFILHSEQNWFFGIRTPWTLSSEFVWKKTRVFGSILFKIAGAAVIIGGLWRDYLFHIILVSVLLASIIPLIASYVFYVREPLDRAQGIINKYYEKGSLAHKIVTIHGKMVAKKAVAVARRVPELSPDIRFIQEAALLHDIGIIKVNAPQIGCGGSEPYIKHNILGAKILLQEGLERDAKVAENHVDIKKQDIIKQGLPLPHKDFIPATIEEDIISFCDRFYSKVPGKERDEKSVSQIIKEQKKYQKDKRFLEWCKTFKEPLT